MYDDAYTRNENDELAVRTVSVNEGSGTSSYDDVFTRDENGKLALRVTGSGGGGDSHNKGYYATQAALEEAYPTAEAGDYAVVGATDTIWVWDVDSSAWVDTDTKGEVTPDMIIVKSATMPSASTTQAGAVYQYVGTTNATYTHGYIYENVASTTYSSTVTFEAATLSSSTIACSGDDFAAFVAEWGSGDITTITNGTLTYDQSGGLLVFVGKDAEDTTVCTFQLYTEDYQDAGFTITGTLQDGDVFAFTTAITASTSYAWTRVDVQPTPEALPDQTGQNGKFLTTNGTDASWSDKPLVNGGSGTNSINIASTQSGNNSVRIGKPYTAVSADKDCVVAVGASSGAGSDNSIAIGYLARTSLYSAATGSISIGYSSATGVNSTSVGAIALGIRSAASYDHAIAIGDYADANASGAIQIGNYNYAVTRNSDANTVKIANANGNFEIMSADGTIPTARFATDPVADGTYVPTVTITSGVASRSWTTPSGGGSTGTTATLAVADWSSNIQTVNVTGVTSSNNVIVAAAPASQADYTAAGILCTAQGAGTLTFTCTTTPTSAITVNVLILG